jgi:hypothetical protein
MRRSRTTLLAVAVVSLASCGHVRWKPGPGVVTLGEIWLGATDTCGPETGVGGLPANPRIFQRGCFVPGWTHVIVSWWTDAPARRKLEAHSDLLTDCAPERFAKTAHVERELGKNQIMTETAATLADGPFQGSCLLATTEIFHSGCDVQIAAGPCRSTPRLVGSPPD